MKKKIMIIICTVILLISFVIPCFAIYKNFNNEPPYSSQISANDLFFVIYYQDGTKTKVLIKNYEKYSTNLQITITKPTTYWILNVTNSNTNNPLLSADFSSDGITFDSNLMATSTIPINMWLNATTNPVTSIVTNDISEFTFPSGISVYSAILPVAPVNVSANVGSVTANVDTSSTNDILTKIFYITIFFGLLAFAMNFIHKRSLNV